MQGELEAVRVSGELDQQLLHAADLELADQVDDVQAAGSAHDGTPSWRNPDRSADVATGSRFTTRAGLPATTTSGGTSAVTTAPAPTMERVPIRAPFRVIPRTSTQTSSSITIGLLFSGGNDSLARRRASSYGWPSKSYTRTPPAKRQCMPMATGLATAKPQ